MPTLNRRTQKNAEYAKQYGAGQEQSELAANIAALPRPHDNANPLWRGPCGTGPLGGITQSMLVRFMSCRERFRLKYVCGLEPHDKWNHRLGYGNMWHVCEEALARGLPVPVPTVLPGLVVRGEEEDAIDCLAGYTTKQMEKYPLQQGEITKWFQVCKVQFPEYVKYWREHPDVQNRRPLMQERPFDVPYKLPSGRVVRLRGKDDSVDLIIDEVTGPEGGIYVQEDKTKGSIDKSQVERQLKFDLQTMLYQVALRNEPSCDLPREGYYRHGGGLNINGVVRGADGVPPGEYPIRGVRYNVVRRPLSGGKGSIKPHEAKSTKKTYTPAESDADFYERLRREYLAADPPYWFFRVRSEVSAQDIKVFRDTCLDPLLETVCDWYDWTTGTQSRPMTSRGLHYRTPFGVYSALEEGGATEYDACLETGSEAGLRRVTGDRALFTELQC